MTARLYSHVRRDLERRERELKALRAVDQSILASSQLPERRQILNVVLSQAMQTIGVPVGMIIWSGRRKGVLELAAAHGIPDERTSIQIDTLETIIGEALRSGQAEIRRDQASAESANTRKHVVPGMKSELAVPLWHNNVVLGVFYLGDDKLDSFNDDDKVLVQTLAVQAKIAVDMLELYQGLGRQLKRLRSLNSISTRIQNPTLDLDTILRLLLTGITAGEGLGFSRAMLFLREGTGEIMCGSLAIGEHTRAEAEAAWARLKDSTANSNASGGDPLEDVLDLAEEFGRLVKIGIKKDRPLSAAVKNVKFKLGSGFGAPYRAILELGTIIVRDGEDDPFRGLFKQDFGVGELGPAFACVPLPGRGSAIGFLVVDNRFLDVEQDIEDDVSTLEAYAGVIAMARRERSAAKSVGGRTKEGDLGGVHQQRLSHNRYPNICDSRHSV